MTEPDDREGCLADVTDEQWLAGHRYLMSLGMVPDEEAAYLYDPDRPAETVTAADLTPGRDPAEPDELPEVTGD